MAPAPSSGGSGELLERMAGPWVLQGTMDGKTTTRDVVATSALNGGYVQLHEVSREKDAQDRPGTWQWRMDGEEKGQLVPFARVTLRHR